MNIVSQLWYWWVELVGGIGLPWDKQMTAYLALGFVFYGIGVAFKTLTQKEK